MERSLQGEVAIVTGVSRSQGIGGAPSAGNWQRWARIYFSLGGQRLMKVSLEGSAIPDWTDS